MSSSDSTTIKLNTGASIPLVGYGTFLSAKGEVGPALEIALKAGYRHIDCAAIYRNEAEIGEVFNKTFNASDSTIKREDVFITSKLWVDAFQPDKVIPALKQTLSDLKLKYLDLYLMHVPVPSTATSGDNFVYTKRSGYTLMDTWRELEKAYDQGLVKAIGVSNFPAVLLNDFQNGARIMPAVHQIELHPYLQQKENVKFNKELGVVLTAYAPLGAPSLMKSQYDNESLKPLLENDTIKEIAQKHKVTSSQVLIRWSVQRGITVIPKSVNKDRIINNFDVFSFKLDDSDMDKIAKLDKGHRTFAQAHLGVPMFM